MRRPEIRLVCFDLGNVVLRLRRSWLDGCDVVGLERRGDVPPLTGPAWETLETEYETGRIDVGAFTRRLSALIGGLYTPEEILRVHQVYIDAEYDGALAVVERVKEAGVATAALSNTCAEHWIRIPHYPAVRALDRHFASHLMGLRKPDAAIYGAVEEASGFRGEEIAFFDDRAENVAAARTRGWHAVQVDPAGHPPAQTAAALERLGVLATGAEAEAEMP